MKHYELSDDLRTRLLEGADWAGVGITRKEVKAKLDERKEDTKKEVVAEKAKETDSDNEDADLDALIEQALHTCPLCLTEMEDTIEEDRLLEHLEVASKVLDTILAINESDENADESLSEALASLYLQTIDFEDEDEIEAKDEKESK